MYIILDLDDFQNVEVVKDESCRGYTMLFSTPEEAEEYANANLVVYQVVELNEES